MKLYYYKNAGSFAVRIIANELDLKIDYDTLKELQVKEKVTASEEDFYIINPKNQIPALLLDDGRMLTECAVILQYLADLKENDTLTQSKNFNKYRVLEWLNFTATELHKNFVPLISPIIPADAKLVFMKIFINKLKFVNKSLDEKEYLVGGVFTVADAYLFTILSWFKFIKLEMKDFPFLESYYKKLKVRPSIVKSLMEEKIID